MRISTKGRYALRVLIDLATNQSDRYLPLKEIAERQQISEKYLESIIVLLSKADLLDGHRGKGGGYRLKRSPSEYSVGEILRLVENNMTAVACLDCDSKGCERASDCRTLSVWQNLQTRIDDYLDSITLADL